MKASNDSIRSKFDGNIEVDTHSQEITVPHWGVTLRSLFGAAVQCQPCPPDQEVLEVTYSLILKGRVIGVIKVATYPRKPNQLKE